MHRVSCSKDKNRNLIHSNTDIRKRAQVCAEQNHHIAFSISYLDFPEKYKPCLPSFSPTRLLESRNYPAHPYVNKS